jgi:hypothetical protein
MLARFVRVILVLVRVILVLDFGLTGVQPPLPVNSTARRAAF